MLEGRFFSLVVAQRSIDQNPCAKSYSTSSAVAHVATFIRKICSTSQTCETFNSIIFSMHVSIRTIAALDG